MSAPEHEKELAKELRLRPERPQVTRLSRRVLIALSGVSVAAILGLTFFALQQRGRSGLAPELYNTDAKTTADGLAGLPRDYAGLPKDVPKLGPPLPGDLGRPILAAQGQLPPTGVDPEEQRLGQEREAARTSKLFASTNVIEHAAAALTSAARPRVFGRHGLGHGSRAARSRLPAKHAGSKTRLRQRAGRSPHGQSRSSRRRPPRAMSCRLARSFRRRSSPAFVPIFPDKSPPR